VYSKILVPLDGSKLSEGVLPYARMIARAINLPVELLFVNPALRAGPHAPPMQGGEYLAEVAASFAGVADVKCTVELGDPAGTIVDLVARQPQTLIAMATHGYSGAQRWLLGSVTEKVLHAAPNHLLLVRPRGEDSSGEARLKTVVVPLDGSGLAEAVLPTVRDWAARLLLEVVLVRVLPHVSFAPPDAFLPVFGMNLPNQKEIWAQARSEATEYLNGKVEHLRAAGLSDVTALVIDGSAGGAAAEIIDLAKKTSDNMVAMSTHGASGVGRWLIGNVTERVVRYSSDPVLVIRPQDRQ
jgi:nucleotide-binding universal stress UspA family protein